MEDTRGGSGVQATRVYSRARSTGAWERAGLAHPSRRVRPYPEAESGTTSPVRGSSRLSRSRSEFCGALLTSLSLSPPKLTRYSDGSPECCRHSIWRMPVVPKCSAIKGHLAASGWRRSTQASGPPRRCSWAPEHRLRVRQPQAPAMSGARQDRASRSWCQSASQAA